MPIFSNGRACESTPEITISNYERVYWVTVLVADCAFGSRAHQLGIFSQDTTGVFMWHWLKALATFGQNGFVNQKI
jgi:hypothetical protein